MNSGYKENNSVEEQGSVARQPSGVSRVPVQRSEVFSKFNKFIFGYFDPVNIYFYNKNKYFSG